LGHVPNGRQYWQRDARHRDNMEDEILKKFDAQDKKLDDIYRSVEKTRKYFLWMMVVTIAMIVLPLIGLIFAIPQFLSIYSNLGAGL
jgi:type II secretory pathway component PulF